MIFITIDGNHVVSQMEIDNETPIPFTVKIRILRQIWRHLVKHGFR